MAEPEAPSQGALPKKMKALQYARPREFAVVEIDVPDVGDDDALVKISACGVCGTDLHYHEGEFLARFPLIPGHEATGVIAAVGKNVRNVVVGDRVVVDPIETCRSCFYCVRGDALMCEDITGYGGTVPGGFAEYCRYPARQVHVVEGISDLEAILIEPAACAAHGIERMRPKPGSRVCLFGCGPTGMLLAQLLRANGAAHLTIVSKGGPKLDLARKLGLADEYVCVPDEQPERVMNELQEANPHGFDIVVEATGARAVLEQSLYYVRKGGTLVVYGVYDEDVMVAWPPSRIWKYEITILASFCSTLKIPVVLEYVKSRRLRLEGIANKTYRIEEWAECLEAVRKQEVVKAAIVFN